MKSTWRPGAASLSSLPGEAGFLPFLETCPRLPDWHGVLEPAAFGASVLGHDGFDFRQIPNSKRNFRGESKEQEARTLALPWNYFSVSVNIPDILGITNVWHSEPFIIVAPCTFRLVPSMGLRSMPGMLANFDSEPVQG